MLGFRKLLHAVASLVQAAFGDGMRHHGLDVGGRREIAIQALPLGACRLHGGLATAEDGLQRGDLPCGIENPRIHRVLGFGRCKGLPDDAPALRIRNPLSKTMSSWNFPSNWNFQSSWNFPSSFHQSR